MRLGTHLPVLVLALEQLVHDPCRREALVSDGVFALGVPDVRTDDGGEILQVHLGPGLLVDVRKGRDPFEEDEKNLHRIAVRFRHEAADVVADAVPFDSVFDACRLWYL